MDISTIKARDTLTILEVAKYLRVSRTTVWRWCTEGKIPAFKVGKTWRIHRANMQEMVDEQMVQGTLSRLR